MVEKEEEVCKSGSLEMANSIVATELLQKLTKIICFASCEEKERFFV